MARELLTVLTVGLSILMTVYGQTNGNSNDTLPASSAIISSPESLPPSTSILSSPSVVTTAPDSWDDSTMPHISMPVAVVAGTLSGIIAILAAVLVFVVLTTRRKRQRRMLHEMMAHSGSAFDNEQGWSPDDGSRNQRRSGSWSTHSSSSKPYFEYISSPSEYSHRKFIPQHSAKSLSPRSRTAVSDLGLEPSLSNRSSSSLSPSRAHADVPPAYIENRN